jgi:hypothetical protein
MRHILAASAIAMALSSGLAHAQSATETTTTQTTGMAPPAVAQAVSPPPPGTLSTTRTVHAVDAYGNRVDSQASSYRDTQGVAEDRQTTVTTAPPPPVTTTTTTTQSTTTSATTGPN